MPLKAVRMRADLESEVGSKNAAKDVHTMRQYADFLLVRAITYWRNPC